MRVLFLVWALYASGAWSASAACFAPAGDWITGADLAAAAPALAGLAPDLKVGYAPVAGIERVFHPDELRRLALAHGLAAPRLTANICFAWPVAPLAETALRTAMEKTLLGRAPQLEIGAHSLAPAPAGEIVFPLSGLSAYAETPVVWKGYVRYAGERRFAIWASVRVTVHETHLRAQGAIHAGERLRPGQWRAERYSGPLLHAAALAADTDLAGLVARRDFADGALLVDGFFTPPAPVEKDDTVTVLAARGAATVEAPAVALAAGRAGDVIAVRNPRSNRTFKARVTSPGRVEALPGSSAGLAAGSPL